MRASTRLATAIAPALGATGFGTAARTTPPRVNALHLQPLAILRGPQGTLCGRSDDDIQRDGTVGGRWTNAATCLPHTCGTQLQQSF